jgi:hypothetical protein
MIDVATSNKWVSESQSIHFSDISWRLEIIRHFLVGVSRDLRRLSDHVLIERILIRQI